jgi:hypothetical protein
MTLFQLISSLCATLSAHPDWADKTIRVDTDSVDGESPYTNLKDPEFVSVHKDGLIVFGRD